MPKHPQVKVKLIGEDGNAMAIIARCHRAARHELSSLELDKFHREAKSKDYDHLLRTCMDWFDCD